MRKKILKRKSLKHWPSKGNKKSKNDAAVNLEEFKELLKQNLLCTPSNFKYVNYFLNIENNDLLLN